MGIEKKLENFLDKQDQNSLAPVIANLKNCIHAQQPIKQSTLLQFNNKELSEQISEYNLYYNDKYIPNAVDPDGVMQVLGQYLRS